jgi:hypothetical protein
MRFLILCLLLVALSVFADPIIIGHEDLPVMDQTTVQRIYTGKVVEVQGIRVMPVNFSPGHQLRARFLQIYLQQDEDQYAGYWIVRRYIGKGKPPKDLDSAAEVSRFIIETPGAIGYLDAADVTKGLKILLSNAP